MSYSMVEIAGGNHRDTGQSKYLDANSKEESCSDEMASRVPNILDPDDALMKRFQNALRAHLLRVDEKLSEEIHDMEAAVKSAEKQCEADSLQLYEVQREIAKQQRAIEKYQVALSKIASLREEKEKHLIVTRRVHQEARRKLLDGKEMEEKLTRDLEVASTLRSRFKEWERELEDCLVVSKRISEKDGVAERELIDRKQQRDCVLFKVVQDIARLEAEIAHLDEQIRLKDKERVATSQLVADADADLEALHREHANLCGAWHSVVLNIGKRDRVYEGFKAERDKIQESFDAVKSQMDKIKKDTTKEIETNEHLTSLLSRVEEDIRITSRSLAADGRRANDCQTELAKITKLNEQVQAEYDVAYANYEYHASLEDQIDKELARLANSKNELESTLFDKLREKVTHDKAARYLSKILSDAKESLREQELAVVQAENSYGRNLLELERLKSRIAGERQELQETLASNAKKEKEIDEVKKEISKREVATERGRRKIITLNTEIEQILASTAGEELSPLDLKIMTLRRNTDEIEQSNQKAQQFWLRQQTFMVGLSQRRDAQLHKLNLFDKEVAIMEQRNLKLEYELETFDKEEADADRKTNLLQQRLVQVNAELVTRSELKGELEGKNLVARNEYSKELRDAETDLIRMRGELRESIERKTELKEELAKAQEESLSWEKKVRVVHETAKKMRDERSTGGDVALMKSEIHKMEMRLSHLRRVQERLINDMEFCVSRRDAMLDKVMARARRNPKEQHNQRVVSCKRLEEQRSRIKRTAKAVKETRNRVQELEAKRKDIIEETERAEETLKTIQESVPRVEEEISKEEFVKYHNLKALVFKQHKSRMLHDVKSGQYKMLSKSELSLNDDLQSERSLRDYLKLVMERTSEDFPLLRDGIRKILLILQL